MVRIWDSQSGRELREIRGHTVPITSLAFSPDDSRLAAASQGRFVRIWNVVEQSDPTILKRDGTIHEQLAAGGFAFSPTQHSLACGTSDGCVVLWDLSRLAPPRLLSENRPADAKEGGWEKAMLLYVGSVSFSPDGKRPAATQNSTVKLWNVATGQVECQLVGHAGRVSCAVFSPTNISSIP